MFLRQGEEMSLREDEELQDTDSRLLEEPPLKLPKKTGALP
jgi:hypothetical protein